MGGFFRHSSTSCSSIFMVTTLYCTFTCKDNQTFHYFLVGGFLRHSPPVQVFARSLPCTVLYIQRLLFSGMLLKTFIHLQFKCLHGCQCTYCVLGTSMCSMYDGDQVQSLQPTKLFLTPQAASTQKWEAFLHSPLVRIQCRQLSNLLGLLFEYPLRCSVVSTWPTCRGHLYKQSPKEEGG